MLSNQGEHREHLVKIGEWRMRMWKPPSIFAGSGTSGCRICYLSKYLPIYLNMAMHGLMRPDHGIRNEWETSSTRWDSSCGRELSHGRRLLGFENIGKRDDDESWSGYCPLLARGTCFLQEPQGLDRMWHKPHHWCRPTSSQALPW